MIKIKTVELTEIAIAAAFWFQKQNVLEFYEKELEAATNLQKQLDASLWDEDAELFIDEMPF